MGIDGIGIKTAKQLAKHYKSISKLQDASIEDLITLDDIAEITATDIHFYFSNELNKLELKELLDNFVVLEQENQTIVEGFFSGKKVVLTGTLSKFSRSQAEEFIEKQGGTTSSSVTKATDIVLVGENPGSKFDKAKSLGIYIMFEDEFIKHIN